MRRCRTTAHENPPPTPLCQRGARGDLAKRVMGDLRRRGFSEEGLEMRAIQVSVIIPALDEEAVISQVVRAVPSNLVQDIIVVDNGSHDRTAEVAQAAGARDRLQQRQRNLKTAPPPRSPWRSAGRGTRHDRVCGPGSAECLRSLPGGGRGDCLSGERAHVIVLLSHAAEWQIEIKASMWVRPIAACAKAANNVIDSSSLGLDLRIFQIKEMTSLVWKDLGSGKLNDPQLAVSMAEHNDLRVKRYHTAWTLEGSANHRDFPDI